MKDYDVSSSMKLTHFKWLRAPNHKSLDTEPQQHDKHIEVTLDWAN